MSNGSDGVRRALLISFAPGIGDVVMMEPLLRATIAALPDWRVTLVARDYAADILSPGPYELESPFFYVERPPGPLRPVHRLIPQTLIAKALEPATALEIGLFDRVLNLFLAWEKLVPFEEWWTPQIPPLPGVPNIVDLLADHLETELQTRISMEDRFPRLDVTPEGAEWASRYWRDNELDGRPVAALVVSAANSLKLWTASGWSDLNDRLSERGWRTLMVALADNPHAQQIYQACGTKPLWPEQSLRQLAGVLKRSSVVVGVDTGPLHMAGALGVPWVGLYGPTNPDLIGPYDRSIGRTIVAPFAKEASCKSCWLAFKNQDDECRTLSVGSCTALISVDEVESAVNSVALGMGVA